MPHDATTESMIAQEPRRRGRHEVIVAQPVLGNAWEEVLAVADRIRASRLDVAAGMPLAQAFPLHRGDQCAGCQFSNHCDALQHTVPAAASDTPGECR